MAATNEWQAAVVAGLILLAQLLLRKRLSPAWRHGLWFPLLVRLLMPRTPSSGVSVFNLAKASRPQARPGPGGADDPRASRPFASQRPFPARGRPGGVTIARTTG